MRIAIAGGAFLAAAALCLVPMGTVHAQLAPDPITGFFGNVDAIPSAPAVRSQGSQATNAITVVYDNTLSATNFGFSSTDPAAIFGDELLTTGTGLLSTQKFSSFNGGTSGILLTATYGIQIYDAITVTLLGSYTASVNFGAGLNPGFFATITVTGLDPLVILLPVTDVLVLQSVVSKTGTATKLGIASKTPPTVGSSPNTMFISAADVNGGLSGFYNIGNPPVPANPIYQIGLAPPPVATKSKTWTEIKKLYH
jgi:hypothetical protein